MVFADFLLFLVFVGFSVSSGNGSQSVVFCRRYGTVLGQSSTPPTSAQTDQYTFAIRGGELGIEKVAILGLLEDPSPTVGSAASNPSPARRQEGSVG